MATKDERIIEVIVNGQKANASLKEMEGAARALSSQLKTLAPGTAEFVEKSKQLREVKASVTEVKESIAGVTREQTLMSEGFSRMVGAVAPLELIFKAIEFGKESLADFRGAQQAQAQLEQTLKSTAGAAHMTAEALEALATSQQHQTLFDDDESKGAESLLLTFTNIKKGIYEEALPAIEDMATKMANGGEVDLKSTAIQVGKALNDPIKGITALARVGVTFSEAQKEVIRRMMETGDVAGAQRVILAEVNKEFGGSAAAARRAAGAQGDFSEKMHEAKEAVGSLVADGLNLLYPIILQLVTGFLLLANGIRTLPEFIKENKELFIALGVALVTLNTANIAAAASTLYMTAVEKGRSIATQSSAAAQWLLNAAMSANPIGLVVAAVALLVGGFVKLYNSSQTVRAGIAGLSGAAVAFFESLKKTAMQSLGGLADLISGVFTFDLAKIKSGAAALKDSFGAVGKDTAAAFHAGYKGKVDDEAKAAAAARAAGGKKKVAEAEAQGEAEGEAENSAQRKAREKREKEAVAAAKKRHAELKKATDEFHKSTLKADVEFEKLKVEAMEDGIEKVLAKLKMERDQELAQLVEKKKATLANTAATQADKQHLLEQYHQTALLAEARYQTQVKAATEKQAKEDAKARESARKDDFDKMDAADADKLVELDHAWLVQKAHLKKQSAEWLKAEKDRSDAELKLRRATAAAKLLILQNAGKSETKEATKLKNDLLTIDGALADGDIALAEKTADQKKKFEKSLRDQRFQLADETLALLTDHLNQEGSLYKAAQAVRKTLALAEIGMNLATELTENAKAAAQNPLNGATFGAAGTAQLIVSDGLSITRALAAGAKVMGFARGGFTGGGQGPADSTGHRVAGVVHEGEWVAPKWMLQTPKYANVVGYLEAERKGYAQGGYTSPGSLPPSAAGGGSQAGDETAALLRQLIATTQAQHAAVADWANTLKVDYHAGNAQDAMATKDRLKSTSGL
ncbi:hypothetical protein [Hymenobacter sp. PAMC 26628]|uniref:hypothetical protein n=1 Tax=Hymenobacter sp. PAMC 26628 TaxID=1484118 RepID=UPI0007706A82|nr:hypothetical protein [Hymenobacter sp. PAMC 26628]AMJ65057.1 hypothetical protein AXW84_06150 [Hymenobacter sp. PAMC 26628]